MRNTRAMIISDIHSHHADPDAVEACRLYAVDYKPAVIFFAGDIWDFEAPSRYKKEPELLAGMQDEIDCGVEILSRFRDACPRAKFIFIAGNHEDRLKTLLLTQAPALGSLRCLDYRPLLGLDKLDFVACHEYGAQVKYYGCIIEHGDLSRKGAGASARAMMSTRGMNGISGHTHRLAKVPQRTSAGLRWWIENGCLCDLHPSYCKSQPDWQHGFSIGEVDSRGFFQARPVEILDGDILNE